MSYPQPHDRRCDERVYFDDNAVRPLVCLASGEYAVADLSRGGVRFLPRGLPGFLLGQRLAANITFPNGEAILASGTVHRIGQDGVVIRFTNTLPVPLRMND
ncbi:MAG TPA: PilZ domain-containing protein [Armatimonadota bacterium]|nr:PilZ domain-containing protein [Armatimonadota bacterium]HOS44052.1 PilZ domain-containing protein [Armatimonadota bacterium]